MWKSEYSGYLPLRSNSPLRANMSEIIYNVQQTPVSKLARRAWIIAVAGILVCTTVFLSQRHHANYFRVSHKMGSHFDPSPATSMNSSEGAGWDVCRFNTLALGPYNLTSSIQYSRRVIRAHVAQDAERESLSLINDRLIPDFDSISLNAGQRTLSDCAGILDLTVPVSAPLADASAFMFGIASDVERLEEAFDQLIHWLPYSKAGLLAVVPPSSGAAALETRMRGAGMDVTLLQSGDSFPIRYFSLLRQMYRMKTPQTRWFVLIDDDTFFPSLADLVNHFDKTYDSTKQHYIGTVSEDIEQIKRHSFMAFGGGGMFLSLPLVGRVTMFHDQCLQTDKFEGDQIVNSCILAHSSARLQIDYGLHQLDFKGNPAGFFESGRKALSLHHWKSWFEVPVPKMAKIAQACGNECILQRFRFADSMVLYNGYSIVEYRNINQIDFDLIENTMLESDDRYQHNLGPFRPELQEDVDKITFLMEDTIVGPDHVRQVYIHRDSDALQDEVIEVIWVS